MTTARSMNILLDCLRLEPGAPCDLKRFRAGAWDEVAQLARKQGITPLLFWKLQMTGLSDSVPTPVMDELRDHYLSALAQNTFLYHRLSTMKELLADRGIAFIVLKGSHLAASIYPDIALRTMCDIDILVKREELASAEELLLEEGYGNPKRRTPVDEICKTRHHIEPLRDPVGQIPIEIHWTILRLSSPFVVIEKEFWKEPYLETLENTVHRVLSPEHLLLHLCLHAPYHHRSSSGVKCLYDIALTIRHYQDKLNWDVVEDTARRWRTRNCLYASLLRASEFMNAKVPANMVAKAKKDPLLSYFLKKSRERLFGAREGENSLERLLWQLKIRDNQLERLRYLLRRPFVGPASEDDEN